MKSVFLRWLSHEPTRVLINGKGGEGSPPRRCSRFQEFTQGSAMGGLACVVGGVLTPFWWHDITQLRKMRGLYKIYVETDGLHNFLLVYQIQFTTVST